MRQTLTDEFWGLHKNMNFAFPLLNGIVQKYKLKNFETRVNYKFTNKLKTLKKNLLIDEKMNKFTSESTTLRTNQ